MMMDGTFLRNCQHEPESPWINPCTHVGKEARKKKKFRKHQTWKHDISRVIRWCGRHWEITWLVECECTIIFGCFTAVGLHNTQRGHQHYAVATIIKSYKAWETVTINVQGICVTYRMLRGQCTRKRFPSPSPIVQIWGGLVLLRSKGFLWTQAGWRRHESPSVKAKGSSR